MAPRKPKAAKETPSSSLVTALKFISLAQREVGTPQRTYCQLGGGFATSSDGILSASHKIEEDLEARPHTSKLIAALSHCGKRLSITQLENNLLAIRSGKYFANVPCHDDEFTPFTPDPPTVALGDTIKSGFSQIAHLAQEGAQTVYTSSILLRSGSMLATNGMVALEYWHGLDLPTMIVPKIFVSAVCSVNKKLVGMGASASSLTFWFDDESWLKTQLFTEAWPNMDTIFTMPTIPVAELPVKFFEALRAIEDFSEEGREKGSCWLSEHGISSHKNRSEGASYELAGLGAGTYAIRQLKHIESSCKQIAFGEHCAWFFGDSVRGVIMGVQDGE